MPDAAQPLPAPALAGRRAFARAFDVFAVSVFAVPVLALTVRSDPHGDVPFPPLVIVLYALVPLLVEARLLVRDGASPGKRLSGLAVLGPDGRPPVPVRAGVRTLLAWSVPALAVLFLGWIGLTAVLAVLYLPAAATGARADLADLVAGTRVVFRGDVRDA